MLLLKNSLFNSAFTQKLVASHSNSFSHGIRNCTQTFHTWGQTLLTYSAFSFHSWTQKQEEVFPSGKTPHALSSSIASFFINAEPQSLHSTRLIPSSFIKPGDS